MAGFEVTLHGRFWVTPEGGTNLTTTMQLSAALMSSALSATRLAPAYYRQGEDLRISGVHALSLASWSLVALGCGKPL